MSSPGTHGGGHTPRPTVSAASCGASSHGGAHTPRMRELDTSTETSAPDIIAAQPYYPPPPAPSGQQPTPVGVVYNPSSKQYSYQAQTTGHYQYSAEQGAYGSQPPFHQQNASNGVEKGGLVVEEVSVNETKPTSTGTGQNFHAYHQGATQLKGYRHVFDSWTKSKWKYPNFYRPNTYEYLDQSPRRNRDWFERVYEAPFEDRYISCYDGKIKKLVVQATDDIYDGPHGSTYRRTFIRNNSPWHLRIANWPYNHVDYRRGPPTGQDYPMIILKWLPAVAMLICTLGFPGTQATARQEGKYDPFPYRYYGVPKVVANLLEEPDIQRRALMKKGKTVKPLVQERVLRPRWLCFLKSPGEKNRHGAAPMLVDDWLVNHGGSTQLEYIVVTYTSSQFDHEDPEDMDALDAIAELAARQSGVVAYWIASSCMREKEHAREDVFRISDVIRGAQAIVIALAPSKYDRTAITYQGMIREWGTRVWTFPEVLLSRGTQGIKVFVRGADYTNPRILPKNQFAAEAWNDAQISRDLVDHYEGNMELNQLELVTTAMKCLYSRKKGDKFAGDHAYALMGLMRARPQIDETDSAFQAFARISLANDSDKLLERLICVLPVSPFQEWHDPTDAYGAQLWDIDPTIQVSGIGSLKENESQPDNTIVVDGCWAANVRWKCFTPVVTVGIESWKRLFAKIALHSSPLWFIIACALVAQPLFITRAIGAALLVLTLLILLASPYLVRVMHGGKVWGQQPWFFGFEGYMDIEAVERRIFGTRSNLLKWNSFGSPLCRHHVNQYGEYVADDPVVVDNEIRGKVEAARSAGPGQPRIFTLVDTVSLTVTLFEAERPPIAFLLVGSEGGMMRALGVSYDWSTGTLYRETVFRLETPTQDCMFRIPRAKIGLKRAMEAVRLKGASATQTV